MDEKKTIQRYEVRLRKAGLLRLSDVAGCERVTCADELARVGHRLTCDVPHEQVWIVLLNGKNELRGVVRVAEGGMHGAACTPSDILRPVLLGGASGFGMIHNHPSGDPTPSAADLQLTRTLVEASSTLGLCLVDHVVVTQHPQRWVSMRERECLAFD
jgi:DNA repair protein RadC